MTALGAVRIISHIGVRLSPRLSSGGRPTERWQDKSRSLGRGRPAADGREYRHFARCSLMRDSLHFGKSQVTSGTIARRALEAL
jgi:hypothetical protein